MIDISSFDRNSSWIKFHSGVEVWSQVYLTTRKRSFILFRVNTQLYNQDCWTFQVCHKFWNCSAHKNGILDNSVFISILLGEQFRIFKLQSLSLFLHCIVLTQMFWFFTWVNEAWDSPCVSVLFHPVIGLGVPMTMFSRSFSLLTIPLDSHTQKSSGSLHRCCPHGNTFSSAFLKGREQRASTWATLSCVSVPYRKAIGVGAWT